MVTNLLLPVPRADRKTVIIADDHPIFLGGLERLLSESFNILATALDGRSLVEAACHHRPDAVLVDFAMPKLDGLAALREIKGAGLDCKVIILTVHEDPIYALKCLESGADGYILKAEGSVCISEAVSAVLGGTRWVSPRTAAKMESLQLNDGARDGGESEAEVAASLTPRQRQIIRLICAGEAAKRVGATLGVSPKTVEYHKYKLMRRLGLTTTAQLIKFAVQWRIDAEESSLQG